MKAIVATAVAAAVLLATPALAATRTHRAAPDQTRAQYGDVLAAPQAGVVVQGDRVLGQDPDPAIRTQMLQQGDISPN